MEKTYKNETPYDTNTGKYSTIATLEGFKIIFESIINDDFSDKVGLLAYNSPDNSENYNINENDKIDDNEKSAMDVNSLICFYKENNVKQFQNILESYDTWKRNNEILRSLGIINFKNIRDNKDNNVSKDSKESNVNSLKAINNSNKKANNINSVEKVYLRSNLKSESNCIYKDNSNNIENSTYKNITGKVVIAEIEDLIKNSNIIINQIEELINKEKININDNNISINDSITITNRTNKQILLEIEQYFYNKSTNSNKNLEIPTPTSSLKFYYLNTFLLYLKQAVNNIINLPYFNNFENKDNINYYNNDKSKNKSINDILYSTENDIINKKNSNLKSINQILDYYFNKNSCNYLNKPISNSNKTIKENPLEEFAKKYVSNFRYMLKFNNIVSSALLAPKNKCMSDNISNFESITNKAEYQDSCNNNANNFINEANTRIINDNQIRKDIIINNKESEELEKILNKYSKTTTKNSTNIINYSSNYNINKINDNKPKTRHNISNKPININLKSTLLNTKTDSDNDSNSNFDKEFQNIKTPETEIDYTNNNNHNNNKDNKTNANKKDNGVKANYKLNFRGDCLRKRIRNMLNKYILNSISNLISESHLNLGNFKLCKNLMSSFNFLKEKSYLNYSLKDLFSLSSMKITEVNNNNSIKEALNISVISMDGKSISNSNNLINKKSYITIVKYNFDIINKLINNNNDSNNNNNCNLLLNNSNNSIKDSQETKDKNQDRQENQENEHENSTKLIKLLQSQDTVKTQITPKNDVLENDYSSYFNKKLYVLLIQYICSSAYISDLENLLIKTNQKYIRAMHNEMLSILYKFKIKIDFNDFISPNNDISYLYDGISYSKILKVAKKLFNIIKYQCIPSDYINKSIQILLYDKQITSKLYNGSKTKCFRKKNNSVNKNNNKNENNKETEDMLISNKRKRFISLKRRVIVNKNSLNYNNNDISNISNDNIGRINTNDVYNNVYNKNSNINSNINDVYNKFTHNNCNNASKIFNVVKNTKNNN